VAAAALASYFQTHRAPILEFIVIHRSSPGDHFDYGIILTEKRAGNGAGGKPRAHTIHNKELGDQAGGLCGQEEISLRSNLRAPRASADVCGSTRVMI